MSQFSISIIISTYNQPEWLRKVLIGYEQQTHKAFDIVIADDGSLEATTLVIEKFQYEGNLKISHVWHPDEGFRKTKILNKAILNSHGDYLIFTDGDCIPRNDFVEKHFLLHKENSFLSGGYFKLPLDISKAITKKDIIHQLCFKKEWLLEKEMKGNFKFNKLTASGFKEKFLNKFTPTKATWDGMNASAFKKDLIAVNGFDERMQYGGEDRELGERLINNGVKPIQIRYSAICVHLDHERSYVNQKFIDFNKAIRKETKKQKKVWTNYGIKK